MTKVITYGTYDLLHQGHIRLLERAKALGDYLIVGVTADDFDLSRGKINVSQPLMERIEAVKATGLADKIIVEEYEGQKIDDIRKYDVDIFTVGSDWDGKFDYLKEYCKVVYLERTEGISSSKIRSEHRPLRIGIVGETRLANKFFKESSYVNGVIISGIFAEELHDIDPELAVNACDTIEQLFDCSDAVYISSVPIRHFFQIKMALNAGLHVLCESPVALNVAEYRELSELAKEKGLVLMDGIKTAYSVAFNRLMLLVKGDLIGDVVAIDTTCTSLMDSLTPYTWTSICWWGPTAMLPITEIFGCGYSSAHIVSKRMEGNEGFDLFTHVTLTYPKGVAVFKVAQGVKSEGEMIISGTKGYVYVPAPWWKTDYFEVRYENPAENRRYFYPLEGEGIRHEIRTFRQLTEGCRNLDRITPSQSAAAVGIIEKVIAGEIKKI